MKFVCNKRDFNNVVSHCGSITGGKNNYSILSSILITAGNNKVQIEASNGDMSLATDIDADIEEEGSVAIPQNLLANVLKVYPEGKISLTLNEEDEIYRVFIEPIESKRKINHKIVSFSPEEFPKLPSFPESKNAISLEAGLLKKMISKVAFAASSHATKYALNGILWEYTKDKEEKKSLNLVASDGRKLALFKQIIDLEQNSGRKVEDFRLILPQLFTNYLQKLLPEKDNVQLLNHDGKVFLKFNQYILSSSLVNGEYPDYQVFLPKEHEYILSSNLEGLKNTIKTASSILQGDSTNKIVWSLKPSELACSSNEETGSGIETIEVNYTGREMQIGLNSRMLEEVLGHIEATEVVFQFNSEISPLIVKAKNVEDYLYVVMPIRLNTIKE